MSPIQKIREALGGSGWIWGNKRNEVNISSQWLFIGPFDPLGWCWPSEQSQRSHSPTKLHFPNFSQLPFNSNLFLLPPPSTKGNLQSPINLPSSVECGRKLEHAREECANSTHTASDLSAADCLRFLPLLQVFSRASFCFGISYHFLWFGLSFCDPVSEMVWDTLLKWSLCSGHMKHHCQQHLSQEHKLNKNSIGG